MTLYTQVSQNRRKTWGFMLLFGLLFLSLGWVVAWVYDSSAILVIVAILVMVQGWVSYYHSDSIALLASGAIPLEKGLSQPDQKRVRRLLTNLCLASGLPEPRLFIILDSAMNAFATGRDKDHAALALTAGLVERLTDDELAGVMAHELGHIGNEDIRLMSVVMVMAGVIALTADFFLRSLWFRNDSSENRASGAVMVIGLVLAILAPLAATLIQLAISRKREFMADATGVLITRYPEGLIGALQKISQDTEPLEAANRGTAHLYFANPLKRQFLANLFSTHPAIADRILALQAGTR